MGSDLYFMSRDIALASQPRMAALLQKIQKRMENDSLQDWSDLIEEIKTEIRNGSIQ